MGEVLVRPSGKSLGNISHDRNTRSPDLIPQPKILREHTIICDRVNTTGHLSCFLPSLNILEPLNCRQNDALAEYLLIQQKRPTLITLPDSPDSSHSPDSPDSSHSPDSPDSLDSLDSLDSTNSPHSPDSTNSPHSPDSPDSLDSTDSPDSSPAQTLFAPDLATRLDASSRLSNVPASVHQPSSSFQVISPRRM